MTLAGQPLRAAIVDDEPLARARLRRLLEKVSGGSVQIVIEAKDVGELLLEAAKAPVDLAFLDIEMPGGDGFSALRRWPGKRPHIVFVTAYEEHGVRAFDARALDYLLKPVSATRLLETLNRVGELIAAGDGDGDTGGRVRQISVLVGKRRELVAIDEIDSIIVRRNYLELHVGKRQFVIREALHKFYANLKCAEFVRTHRSSIVRRGAVRSSQAIGSGCYLLELKNGQRLRTGRAYRTAVQGFLRMQRAGEDA